MPGKGPKEAERKYSSSLMDNVKVISRQSVPIRGNVKLSTEETSSPHQACRWDTYYSSLIDCSRAPLSLPPTPLRPRRLPELLELEGW